MLVVNELLAVKVTIAGSVDARSNSLTIRASRDPTIVTFTASNSLTTARS
jgi:hypothetical protein